MENRWQLQDGHTTFQHCVLRKDDSGDRILAAVNVDLNREGIQNPIQGILEVSPYIPDDRWKPFISDKNILVIAFRDTRRMNLHMEKSP